LDRESSQQTSPLADRVRKAAIASLNSAKKDSSRVDAAIEKMESSITPLYQPSVNPPRLDANGIIATDEEQNEG
tara:strand:- start:46 stop:267 length:222 start_codon:yes stop_codon:yes gene_type:complete